MRFLPKAVYDIQFERNHAKRDLKFSSLFFTCKFFAKVVRKGTKERRKAWENVRFLGESIQKLLASRGIGLANRVPGDYNLTDNVLHATGKMKDKIKKL